MTTTPSTSAAGTRNARANTEVTIQPIGQYISKIQLLWAVTRRRPVSDTNFSSNSTALLQFSIKV